MIRFFCVYKYLKINSTFFTRHKNQLQSQTFEHLFINWELFYKKMFFSALHALPAYL